MTDLVARARNEAQTLLSTAPSSLTTSAASPLMTALLTTQRLLTAPASTPSTPSPTLSSLAAQTRRCGRRLEDLLDGSTLSSSSSSSSSSLVARFVEPDLMPLLDAVAAFVGVAARADDDELRALGEAVCVVVEDDVSHAVAALGLAGFFAAGGHLAVVVGLVDSFRALPMGTPPAAVAARVIEAPGLALSLALTLAGPALAAVVTFHVAAAVGVRTVRFLPGQGMLQAAAALAALAVVVAGTPTWLTGFGTAARAQVERSLAFRTLSP